MGNSVEKKSGTILTFLKNYDADDGSVKMIGKGGNKTVYSFGGKVYSIGRNKQTIIDIYDRIDKISEEYKRHVLVPTDIYRRDFLLIMEFQLCKGDLLLKKDDKDSVKIIKSIRKNFKKYKKQFDMLEDIVKAFHKLNLHTLDIKPENILYCGGVLRVTDFDSAIVDDNGQGGRTERYIGSWSYSPQANDLYALYTSIIEILYDDLWIAAKDQVEGRFLKTTKENLSDARNNLEDVVKDDKMKYVKELLKKIEDIETAASKAETQLLSLRLKF